MINFSQTNTCIYYSDQVELSFMLLADRKCFPNAPIVLLIPSDIADYLEIFCRLPSFTSHTYLIFPIE